MRQTHFGLEVRQGAKYGLRLNRATYATINKVASVTSLKEQNLERWEREAKWFEDSEHRIYTDEWCERQRKAALENFDLNIARFEALDEVAFEAAILNVLSLNPGLREVTDLNQWSRGSYLYIMVLDGYKQVYVGLATGAGGLKQRIRQHWSGNKQFDRLIYGDAGTSTISIDSFRALDTSRIFAARASNPSRLENVVLEQMPSEFVLNRIAGGTPANTNELRQLAIRRLLVKHLEG